MSYFNVWPAVFWVLAWPENSPISINEAAIDVVGALDSSNGLQTDPRGLVWHDVHQAILELVAGEIGTDESGRMGFRVG